MPDRPAGRPVIGIIGCGLEDESLNAFAEETGALVAEAGCVLVNGRLGGVMRASARGCRSRGAFRSACSRGSTLRRPTST